MQKPDSETLLQLPHGMAEGRRRHLEARRSSTKAELLADHDESE
jgi:hypothetical protein